MKFETHGLQIGMKVQHTKDNGPSSREGKRYRRRNGEVVDLSRHIFAVRFSDKKYIEWFPYALLKCNEREWMRIRKG